jgi:hypothetical protein
MNASWSRIRERIKETWSDADFDDKALRSARGNLQQMVSIVHERTGEPQGEVRRKLMALL